MPQIILAEGAAPGTPAANTSTIYVKADGKVYLKDDAGTEYDLTATGGFTGDTDDVSEGVTNLYFTEARVRATVATGLADTAGTPAATDSILTILGKIKKAFFTDHSGAGGAVHANAVAAGAAGFMTGTDKTKLDKFTVANPIEFIGGATSVQLTFGSTCTVTFPTTGTLATLGGNEEFTGVKTFASNKLKLAGTGVGDGIIVNGAAITGTATITVPAVTDTLAVKGANVFTAAQDFGNNNINSIKNASYEQLPATSGTTGAVTADFSSGSMLAQAELTGAITYTFTAPPANTWVTIMGGSDGTSTSYGITWPGTVIWYGTAFTATTANKKWMFRAFWDGTNYHAMGTSQA